MEEQRTGGSFGRSERRDSDIEEIQGGIIHLNAKALSDARVGQSEHEGTVEGLENFISHLGVRRSPRIKKVASYLTDMVNPKNNEPFSSKERKKSEKVGRK